MIKILFISTGLAVGGAEVMLFNLLQNIDRSRFQPVVVSLIDRGYYCDLIEELGIPVYILGMNPGKPSLAKFGKLISILRHEEPDILQGWMYHGNFCAQLLGWLSGRQTSVIWNIRHSIRKISEEKPLTQLLIRLGAMTSNKVTKVLFVSQRSQAQHIKLGYDSDNALFLPNGFNIDDFQPDSSAKAKLCRELGIASDSLLIGSFARFHTMKDQPNFLRAASILLKKCPDIHFVMAGANVDDNNHELTKLIAELGIGDNMHLLGRRSDIPQIAPALDIFTTSSAFGEAFPRVVGEAMSCGVPCVVTDVGDSSAIVGDLGKAVPPRDSQAIADAWQELIDLGEVARKELGIKARQKIVELYALDSVVARYETLYQEIAKS